MSPFSHPKLAFDPARYAGFIFDCDGTVADSMPLHFQAWHAAFTACGATFDFTPQLMLSMAGTGTYDSVHQLNERFHNRLDPDRVVGIMCEHLARIHHKVKPIPAVMAIAEALHALGKPISIASGGGAEHVALTLRHTGADRIFDIVVTRDDVERSKPAPDVFLKAAERMGVAPETCLVFEDSLLGIQAADAARMASILVPPVDEL